MAHPNTPTEWHPAIGTNADYQKGLTLSDHNGVRRSFIIERRKFDHTEACIKLYELNEKIETFKAQTKKNIKKKTTTYDSTADSMSLSYRLPHPSTDESNFDTYKVTTGGHHEQNK